MKDWTERFEGLAALSGPVRDELLAEASIIRVPAGTVIFGPGQAPENLLLLLDGQVRVQQVTESGREIVLYRVHAGESCVLTTACLMAFEDYTADGLAETNLEAVAIPKRAFDHAMATSPEFRRFVFAAFSDRITDLFLTVEEIAFGRMDARLAHKLLELSGKNDLITGTHGDWARELGTAREVISRQMAEFARRGWVEQKRGNVRITDRPALTEFARANPI
ncbi:Crp/Fnr family transcriptional regulator [Roseovarius sp. S4756]|uniref:Crp/Fnr family transcriptional regulator n=1 Tax=Roseovarius maritimus TaxID=3342637 RepID=UPI00372B60E4